MNTKASTKAWRHLQGNPITKRRNMKRAINRLNRRAARQTLQQGLVPARPAKLNAWEIS